MNARGAWRLALLVALGGVFNLRAQDTAQEEIQREMQRSSAERDRQSQAFGLQLRQRQVEVQAPPGVLPALEALHAEQRRQFDTLLERQRSDERLPSWGPRLDLGPEQERERRMVLERARRESEAQTR